MNGALSVNIKGEGLSADLITSFTSRLGARSVTSINESKVSALLLSHVPVVVHRMKGSVGIVDDDHAHTKHNPVEFVGALHTLAPAGCYLYLGNEPGSETLDKLNEWTLRAVEQCAKYNRRPVVFNNFVFHPTQKLAGWKKLKSSGQAALAIGGRIGIHVYFDKYVDKSADAFEVIDHVRQTFGDVPIEITEYGCAPGYDPYKGAFDVYGQAEYLHELKAGVQQYGGRNINWHVFLYGRWAEGRGYEIIDAEDLKDGMVLFNRENPMFQPIPIPTTGGRRVRIAKLPAGVTRRNIRDQPRDNATDLTPNERDLKVGDELTLYMNGSHNDWHYIDRGDVKGWVLFTGVEYAFVDTSAPSLTDGIILTPQQHDELSGYVADMRTAADGIEAILKGAASSGGAGGF